VVISFEKRRKTFKKTILYRVHRGRKGHREEGEKHISSMNAGPWTDCRITASAEYGKAVSALALAAEKRMERPALLGEWRAVTICC